MEQVQVSESNHPLGEKWEMNPKARVPYGLPCAHCGAYYLAVIDSCPICESRERVSPTASARQVRVNLIPNK